MRKFFYIWITHRARSSWWEEDENIDYAKLRINRMKSTPRRVRRRNEAQLQIERLMLTTQTSQQGNVGWVEGSRHVYSIL
jgi:hypothetical protein